MDFTLLIFIYLFAVIIASSIAVLIYLAFHDKKAAVRRTTNLIIPAYNRYFLVILGFLLLLSYLFPQDKWITGTLWLPMIILFLIYNALQGIKNRSITTPIKRGGAFYSFIGKPALIISTLIMLLGLFIILMLLLYYS